MNKQQTLIDLMSKQRKDIETSTKYEKMNFNEILRLDKFLKGSIFSDDCSFYSGTSVGDYSTFTLRGFKVSLLRLLYHNYVACINTTDIIEYLCNNPKTCCSIKHFKIKTIS